MANINMTNMNTLFRKGYLLAGVMMAANMFVVNEVKASDNKDSTNIDDNKEQEGGEKEKERDKNASSLESVLNFVLSRENTINLIGGAAFSVANNYLKWWNYNPGGYLNLRIGCLGWRTKKLFDIVQVDINLNVGRGISWVILGAYNLIKGFTAENNQDAYFKHLHVSFLIACRFEKYSPAIALILSFLFQGFVSAPLIFHISNFNISISLDSILWGGIGIYLNKGKQREQGEKTADNADNEAELKNEDNKSEESQESSKEKEI